MTVEKKTGIMGNSKGRVIAPEGTEEVHRSQWYPEKHPGRSQVPYLLHPKSVIGIGIEPAADHRDRQQRHQQAAANVDAEEK